MDENGSEDVPQGREVVDESRYYLLGRTPEGWGVWDRTLSSDEPVAFYPDDDNSYDLAAEYFSRSNRTARFRRWSIRTWSWLDVLQWAAYVSGATWVISSSIVNIYVTSQIGKEGQAFESTRWIQAVGAVANPIFIASVGAFVVTWLRSRERPK